MLFAGKRAFVVGVSDDNTYGWAIDKFLAGCCRCRNSSLNLGVPVIEIYNSCGISAFVCG